MAKIKFKGKTTQNIADLELQQREPAIDLDSGGLYMGIGNGEKIKIGGGTVTSVDNIQPDSYGNVQLNAATKIELTEHTTNISMHVSPEEKENWNRINAMVINGTTDDESEIKVPGSYDGLILSIVAEVFCIHDGEGTPSSENIWPIIGKDQLKVTHVVEPNVEDVYTIQFPETIYGLPNSPETITIHTGQITQTTNSIKFMGNELDYLWGFSETQPTNINLARFILPDLNISNKYNGICSHFPWIDNPNPSTQDTECIGGYSSSGSLYLYIQKNRLSGWSDGWTNTQKIAALKTWLSSQYMANKPVHIVYETTHSTISIMQSTSIYALPGINLIYTDGNGKVTTSINPMSGQPHTGPGNVLFATFELSTTTGHLTMYTPDDYRGPVFRINYQKGTMEVLISGDTN